MSKVPLYSGVRRISGFGLTVGCRVLGVLLKEGWSHSAMQASMLDTPIGTHSSRF